MKNLKATIFETFKRVITPNKLQVIMAIARLRPESINSHQR